jgi:hypothetical protein
MAYFIGASYTSALPLCRNKMKYNVTTPPLYYAVVVPRALSSLYRPRESEQYLIFSTMTVRLNFGRHWFPFDKMGLKQFS